MSPPPDACHRSAGIFGTLEIPFGFGLLRLGTDGRPSEEDAISLLHLAFDLGIRWIDTADSYSLHEKEKHYGERLARKAIECWNGPRESIRVATKIGMIRPQGKWVPSGSPDQLRRALEGSLEALGTNKIFLLQLHVKDPRVPFETTLEALAKMQQEGLVEHLGLCNVGPGEWRQAARHFSVATIQNELSVLARASAADGMLEWTKQSEIPFLAYRPLGGYANVEKLFKNRTLVPMATKYEVSPAVLAIGILLQSAPHILPILGARRPSSLRDSVSALRLRVDEEDLQLLRSKFSFASKQENLASIQPRILPNTLPKLQPNQGPGDFPEVVLLMGIQGAGKSELVRSYTDRGYLRLNRDAEGGKLDDLLPRLMQAIDEGAQRVVLDNTYPTRISRAPVIDTAHYFGLPVRCRWIQTSIADARINVVHRILDRYDKLLGPGEMKELSKSDPNLPPPAAMQRWMESMEPPALDEGFSSVDLIPFQRRFLPEWKAKGLLLDVDGTIRKTKSGELYPREVDDIEILPNRREVLKLWIDRGFKLFFVSNQSGISSGKLSVADAEACFRRTIELLELPVEGIAYCPHPAFPVGCFCRKPMPGLGISLLRKYRLDPKSLIVVGDLKSDREFAEGIQASYWDANTFFGSDGKVDWKST